jgi:hypothetical protein
MRMGSPRRVATSKILKAPASLRTTLQNTQCFDRAGTAMKMSNYSEQQQNCHLNKFWPADVVLRLTDRKQREEECSTKRAFSSRYAS